MPFDPHKYDRRSTRLDGYNYAQEGAYFVMICTQHRVCLFGKMVEDRVDLNPYGEIIRDEWLQTAVVRPYVLLDAFVVMPNHVHGIIVITRELVGATRRVAPTPVALTATPRPTGPPSGSLGAIIGQFKSLATKRINLLRGTPGESIWQRNFYDRIIRNERMLNAIRQYIETNPAQWAEDSDNPDNFNRR